MPNLSNANIIKALLIDFIETSNLIVNCIYGNELFYGSKKRQTDLLAVNGSTTAFEIKSKSDDFRKIRDQLNDYKKVFDYQYLVTTSNHIDKAKKILKTGEGLIIIYDDKKIEIKRIPKQVTKLNKTEILETIPLNFLKKHFNLDSQYKTAKEVRTFLVKKSITEVRFALLIFLKERLSPRNRIFIEEKGTQTHYEDLNLLKRIPNVII